MKRKTKQQNVKCPYCGRPAILRDAAYVYKENALDKHLYVCSGYPECDSYVGVHAGTMKPKGTLANGDLRHKRIETHRLFDAIWKTVSFPEKMHTAGYRTPSAYPAIRHISVSSQIIAATV